MPFTLFHFGPALFLGLLLFRHIGFLTFLVASVIVDIEPFLVILLGLNYPLHGFFHSFLGGSLVAVALSLLMVQFSKQKPAGIWLAAFSGIYLHILLDSPLYTDIKPFYPLAANPFYGLVPASMTYAFCALLFLAGILLYFVRGHAQPALKK